MLTVFVRSVLIYIFLALALRLMGKRQVGELEITELVSALFLSELATMAIDDAEEPLAYVVLPILCILLLEVIISFAATKLPFVKKTFESHPSILIRKGELDQIELSKMRMSLDELLGELRLQGVSSISDVNYAIMEQNGQLSVFKKKEEESDSSNGGHRSTKDEGIDHPLVIDGKIQQNNCLRIGRQKKDIDKMLKEKKCSLEDTFLLSLNDAGRVTHIRKDKRLK